MFSSGLTVFKKKNCGKIHIMKFTLKPFLSVQLMTVSIFIIHNHPYHLSPEDFHPPQTENLYLLDSDPSHPFPPHTLASTILLSTSENLTLRNGIMQYLSFYVRLISLNTVSSKASSLL